MLDTYPASRFPPIPPPDSANPLVSQYDRRACPEGLITRRQLRERALIPGGHGPVAVLRCKASMDLLCEMMLRWRLTPERSGFLQRFATTSNVIFRRRPVMPLAFVTPKAYLSTVAVPLAVICLSSQATEVIVRRTGCVTPQTVNSPRSDPRSADLSALWLRKAISG